MPATPTAQIDNGVYNRMADTWWDENGVLNLQSRPPTHGVCRTLSASSPS
jgi:hypothetical protein